ncbi:immunoglobulin heavy constant gamma 2 [Odontesthes bonariensis]
MNLNPPTNKEIFINRRAELKCSITGPDTILSETNVIWEIDGKRVTENGTLETSTKSKTSILTRNLNDWKSVKNVHCSAVRNGVTLDTQELTVNRKGANPTVTVLIPTAEASNQGDSAEVRLACLVFSYVEQDYYIAWSVDKNGNSGSYEDTTFTRQKTKNGYLVTSVYTTTKKEWDAKKMFNCNVWPAGSDEAMEPHGVSKASDFPSESNCIFESNCTYEEDDFSSLWSTASTFILLFIFSLFYNMIFSLVQMKRQ